MLDVETANRWGLSPDFLEQSRHWLWCRSAFPAVILGSDAVSGASAEARVNAQALANAFWPWVAALEREAGHESEDPVDFSHFAAGMLLYHLLKIRTPLTTATTTPRGDDVFAMTRLALTLLAAWRLALGAAPLHLKIQDRSSAQWASYLENIAEDPGLAVPFLDLFTGQEPAWQYPLTLRERPVFRRMTEKRRASATCPA